MDEIDRLKLQNLEQLRDIYDQNEIAMIFIGMPGVEKRFARYTQLYSRIGFAHEFDRLRRVETHHILEFRSIDGCVTFKKTNHSSSLSWRTSLMSLGYLLYAFSTSFTMITIGFVILGYLQGTASKTRIYNVKDIPA